MTETARADLKAFLQAELRKIAPDSRVEIRVRPDGLLDVTAVSSLFEGKDSEARERAFWPVLQAIPREERVRMTYSLLLAPEEAKRYFA